MPKVLPRAVKTYPGDLVIRTHTQHDDSHDDSGNHDDDRGAVSRFTHGCQDFSNRDILTLIHNDLS